jgi:purine-binding chemotaxis protein CheW
MEIAKAVTRSYLTFRLDDELFATNVTNVIEILEMAKITKVPGSPSFMRGVINLRGNVLPVIDARVKFGLEKAQDTVNTCIVVLKLSIEEQSLTIGALVDAVQEVLEFDDEKIQCPPSIGSRYKTEFIEGMIKMKEQFIMLLNVNKVFNAGDMSILQDATEAMTSIN